MRPSKRRASPQPLNFTPDERKTPREERSSRGVPAKPTPTASTDHLDGPSAPDRARASAPVDIGWARHAYALAGTSAAAWALLLVTFTIGYVGGVAGLLRAPLHLAVLAMMVVLPALLAFACAGFARQGARLAAEARWARSLSDDLVLPAALAAGETAGLAQGVRQEVERASAAAIAAHGQLVSVRETLAGETDRLTEAAAQAQHVARAVGEALGRERDQVAATAAALREQSAGLGDAVERQSQLVAQACDLARSQLQEAEATLASGAERLAAASGDTGRAARRAGEELTHQAERLDVAAAALSERLRFLEARLNDQRQALGALAQALETGEDDLAVRLESHRAQVDEVLAQARVGAGEVAGSAQAGAQALQELIASAGEQTREMAASVRAEQASLRQEAAEARLDAQNALHATLDALARAGEDARRALAEEGQELQRAVSGRLASARREAEEMGEAAAVVGQRADSAFQARLAEARRVIDQTASLVEEAGRRAGERIENGLGASRGAMGELVATLGDIDERLARAPGAARAQAEAVRGAVEGALDAMTSAARRAAEETRTLDAAFQDRIRRNYETLSEAVRLMGRAAGSVESGEPAPRRLPPATPDIPVTASQPVTAAEDAFAILRPAGAAARADPRPTPDPPTEPPQAPGAADLRPRLRFTPTAADEALKAVFSVPPPESPSPSSATKEPGRGEPEEWTWKDLLASAEDETGDLDALAGPMTREIQALGIDSAALLPRAKLTELATSLWGGDAAAARDAVRRLAPAAIRRLSRRVLTDAALREQVDRFIARHRERLGSAGSADAAAGLLGSDSGRAYLLIEAAVGDL